MKIQIKSVWGSLLFEGDFSSLAECLTNAIKNGADLRSANLYSADLSGANLRSADLYSADLRSANLSSADLSSADLSSADLRSANLSSADLSSADLYSADLSSANLSSADLSSADLSSADLYKYAQVSFRGHGECGRMLTAIQQDEKSEVRLFCGCFNGSKKDLEKYIADGDPKLVPSRTLAMNTVLMLLEVERAT